MAPTQNPKPKTRPKTFTALKPLRSLHPLHPEDPKIARMLWVVKNRLPEDFFEQPAGPPVFLFITSGVHNRSNETRADKHDTDDESKEQK